MYGEGQGGSKDDEKEKINKEIIELSEPEMNKEYTKWQQCEIEPMDWLERAF